MQTFFCCIQRFSLLDLVAVFTFVHKFTILTLDGIFIPKELEIAETTIEVTEEVSNIIISSSKNKTKLHWIAISKMFP